jgi:predicted O-methyltransferase YrrM
MISVIKRAVLDLAKRSRLVTDLADLIHYQTKEQKCVKDGYSYLREQFVKNGENNVIGTSVRESLVSKFEAIDREVAIGSSPTDGLFLAEMLLNLQADGAIIECGCYAGGSSAKLSLVAKLLNRKLFIFDSFEGLPGVEQYYLKDKHCRRSDDWVSEWSKGRYAARIDEVQENIERFGDLSVCSLVKGWFDETLVTEKLPHQVAFAFVDVDLANSARDCFTAIWPILSDSGIYVTHDTAYIKVLQELYNPALWRDQFKSIPPILFGAGYGLCNDSPHIGYMVKGEQLSPNYLKTLTLDK